eukprot:495890_1
MLSQVLHPKSARHDRTATIETSVWPTAHHNIVCSSSRSGSSSSSTVKYTALSSTIAYLLMARHVLIQYTRLVQWLRCYGDGGTRVAFHTSNLVQSRIGFNLTPSGF